VSRFQGQQRDNVLHFRRRQSPSLLVEDNRLKGLPASVLFVPWPLRLFVHNPIPFYRWRNKKSLPELAALEGSSLPRHQLSQGSLVFSGIIMIAPAHAAVRELMRAPSCLPFAACMSFFLKNLLTLRFSTTTVGVCQRRV